MNPREIDALIIQNIFPEKLIHPDGHVCKIEGDWIKHYRTSDGSWTGSHGIPHYSTSIADAWLVVEKMREKHLIHIISDGAHPLQKNTWGCIIERERDEFPRLAESESATAPTAICLAALKALGVDYEQSSLCD